MAAMLREMGQINIMKLINAIKVRPALYNKEDKMYSSRNFKYRYKLWREVCQEVYRNWDGLTTQDKVDYARELRKRWKSLRNCFARELSFQKKEKIKRESNEPIRRRKKYSYFDDLLFLLPPDKLKEYESNNLESDSDDDPLASNNPNTTEYNIIELGDIDSNQEEIEEDEDVSTFNNSNNKKESNDFKLKTKPGDVQPIEYTRPEDHNALDIVREIRVVENDEDKMFALSLVSIFKNLNPKKKLEARIEVLKLLHNISYRNDDADHLYYNV